MKPLISNELDFERQGADDTGQHFFQDEGLKMARNASPSKRVRHSSAEIQGKLRETERLLSEGVLLTEACESVGISRATYYRWRPKTGKSSQDDLLSSAIGGNNTRPNCLKSENEALRRLVVDLLLEMKSGNCE